MCYRPSCVTLRSTHAVLFSFFGFHSLVIRGFLLPPNPSNEVASLRILLVAKHRFELMHACQSLRPNRYRHDFCPLTLQLPHKCKRSASIHIFFIHFCRHAKIPILKNEQKKSCAIRKHWAAYSEIETLSR